MNIFVTDTDPKSAAESLDDRRVMKMAIETCQILSTAIRVSDLVPKGINSEFLKREPKLYKSYCPGGRFVKWVSESQMNFLWGWMYADALITENRYRGFKADKTAAVVKATEPFIYCFPDKKDTPFVGCSAVEEIVAEYKFPITTAYRFYLNGKWNQDARLKWTRRTPPFFRSKTLFNYESIKNHPAVSLYLNGQAQ